MLKYLILPLNLINFFHQETKNQCKVNQKAIFQATSKFSKLETVEEIEESSLDSDVTTSRGRGGRARRRGRKTQAVPGKRKSEQSIQDLINNLLESNVISESVSRKVKKN